MVLSIDVIILRKTIITLRYSPTLLWYYYYYYLINCYYYHIIFIIVITILSLFH